MYNIDYVHGIGKSSYEQYNVLDNQCLMPSSSVLGRWSVSQEGRTGNTVYLGWQSWAAVGMCDGVPLLEWNPR